MDKQTADRQQHMTGEERNSTLHAELIKLDRSVTNGTMDRDAFDAAFQAVKNLTVDNAEFRKQPAPPRPEGIVKPSIPTQVAQASMPAENHQPQS